MMVEIICKRCGQCCCYPDPKDKQLIKQCKHLAILRDGSYYCKAWSRRNAMLKRSTCLVVDRYATASVICQAREAVPYDFYDCPYNNKRPKAPWAKKVMIK